MQYRAVKTLIIGRRGSGKTRLGQWISQHDAGGDVQHFICEVQAVTDKIIMELAPDEVILMSHPTGVNNRNCFTCIYEQLKRTHAYFGYSDEATVSRTERAIAHELALKKYAFFRLDEYSGQWYDINQAA